VQGKKPIELSPQDVQGLLERVADRSLEDTDYQTIERMIENLLFLRHAYQEKSITVSRLLRLLFGAGTEKMRDLFGPAAATGAQAGRDPPGRRKKKEKKKRKGHGRNGKASYPGAQKVPVPHPELRAGGRCPGCEKGKVYHSVKPGVLLRFFASVPVQAKVYEQEKLRCNLCGEIFTAPTPEEAGKEKYDETVGAMIAVLKYGYGFPFHRIEQLQQSMGIPLPASTQWEIALGTWQKASAAHEELIRQAAQGEILHNDDTTMKILALMNLQDAAEQEEQSLDRTGLFTTGILSVKEDRKIALYFTGKQHAGENLQALLQHREADRDPPIQMCDALSRNLPKSFSTVLANCLSHARRNFVEVAAHWPQECQYVIETLGKVYKNDEIAKDRKLSPAERLGFHQTQSGPLMEKLKEWLQEQFDQKKVEPNSSLGKAIRYMQNHWEPLTLFLRVQGAPLHNNLCEQALKRAILHRKNALFFKTQQGAEVGDGLMGLIQTCNLAGSNPFEYLTALQLHHEAVRERPHLWMPWNYKEQIPRQNQ
jgi:hypothetical protein